MIYSVKWVKEHLNVTPDMIRRYESEGLMNKDYYQNPITNRREYTQREIDKLWEIKIYLNMGFTLKQIKKIFETSDSKKKFEVGCKLKENHIDYKIKIDDLNINDITSPRVKACICK